LQTIAINRLEEYDIIQSGLDPKLEHRRSKNNPVWEQFVKYCVDRSILSTKELVNVPAWLGDMMADKLWRSIMKHHFWY
jgi:hypothetical protein